MLLDVLLREREREELVLKQPKSTVWQRQAVLLLIHVPYPTTPPDFQKGWKSRERVKERVIKAKCYVH